jgi:hypothetical protein
VRCHAGSDRADVRARVLAGVDRGDARGIGAAGALLGCAVAAAVPLVPQRLGVAHRGGKSPHIGPRAPARSAAAEQRCKQKQSPFGLRCVRAASYPIRARFRLQVAELATGALEAMLASADADAAVATDLLSLDLVLLSMPEVQPPTKPRAPAAHRCACTLAGSVLAALAAAQAARSAADERADRTCRGVELPAQPAAAAVRAASCMPLPAGARRGAAAVRSQARAHRHRRVPLRRRRWMRRLSDTAGRASAAARI